LSTRNEEVVMGLTWCAHGKTKMRTELWLENHMNAGCLRDRQVPGT